MAMTHDPLCSLNLETLHNGGNGATWDCVCTLIVRVRADERARMTGAKPSGMSDLTVTDSPHD